MRWAGGTLQGPAHRPKGPSSLLAGHIRAGNLTVLPAPRVPPDLHQRDPNGTQRDQVMRHDKAMAATRLGMSRRRHEQGRQANRKGPRTGKGGRQRSAGKTKMGDKKNLKRPRERQRPTPIHPHSHTNKHKMDIDVRIPFWAPEVPSLLPIVWRVRL